MKLKLKLWTRKLKLAYLLNLPHLKLEKTAETKTESHPKTVDAIKTETETNKRGPSSDALQCAASLSIIATFYVVSRALMY
ncbi:hypothetical protein DPMN_012755 [Dreissena polymorpha]|uniref:Uncharacterized protein n=1 Tax=Dreissena polymorpha TaxID=45954 RepID=A0A9D4H4E5_DREPO|nr:hypothetical protein DPMN_128661 [Dreissena polymorpha]KAH3888715.1 hypothetical protein DPMN_012755 [Dreissena polymorpha]